MDVHFSEEQELLRASARELLARECPMALVREMLDDPRGVPESLWKRTAELGWQGLPIPGALGGGGCGLLDLVVLLEETGRVLMPGPFFSSVVLGAGAVQLAGSAEQAARWLPGLAAGASRGTLALLETDERWDAAGVQLRAERADGGLRLTGEKRFVPDAQSADWIAVAAREATSDALLLAVIDARAEGVRIEPTRLIDATRKSARVQLDGVLVPEADLLSSGTPTDAALARLLDRARVALCAEMIGGAQQVLDLCVAYARTREQFGRPIGSFQAIQHRCADMLVALEGMRSITWRAAWALAEDVPDAPAAAAMAKAFCSDAYARIAGDGIQIHGGLGFTWEQDLHLYFRRAKASELWLGDACWNREQVARALLDC